jgi:tetratricopeptide (TPR) repeat protein
MANKKWSTLTSKMSPESEAEFRRIIAEGDALLSALNAIQNHGLRDEAITLLRALETHSNPEDLEVAVTLRAVTLITGDEHPIPRGLPLLWSGDPWEGCCYETGIRAWLSLTEGDLEETKRLVQSIRDLQETNESCAGRSGAIHLLGLYLWLGALDHQAKGNLTEAKRLWDRAIKLSGSYGTESSVIIRWAYAATFFPTAVST